MAIINSESAGGSHMSFAPSFRCDCPPNSVQMNRGGIVCVDGADFDADVLGDSRRGAGSDECSTSSEVDLRTQDLSLCCDTREVPRRSAFRKKLSNSQAFLADARTSSRACFDLGRVLIDSCPNTAIVVVPGRPNGRL